MFPFIQLLNKGLSCIPVEMPSKRPKGAWREFQRLPPTPEQVRAWNSQNGAIICGAVSGNLICIDFDANLDNGESVFHTFMEHFWDITQIDEPVIQRTPSNGYHIVVRCEEPVEGNTKLAATADHKVLIETRGEGGYFVASPSEGYEIIQGSWAQIPTVSREQLDLLFDHARSFDAKHPLPTVTHMPQKPHDEQPQYSEHPNMPQGLRSRVGDEFDEKATTADIVNMLTVHGWTQGRTRADGSVEMVRPGKALKEGISATVGWAGRKGLYVFTSSTEFEPDSFYKPHQVLCFLKYGGDFKRMAKDLALADSSRTGLETMRTQKGLRIAAESAKVINKRKEFAQDMPDMADTTKPPLIDAKQKTTGQSKVKPIDEVRIWLQANYEFRYNTLRERTEVNREHGWDVLTDRDIDTILVSLTDNAINYSKEKLLSLLNSRWVDSFNPIAEWLDSLETWDEDNHPDYIDMLASTVRLVSHDQDLFFRKWLKNWLVATMATWTRAGLNHTCLVLQGPQGVGKTQWLNKLCPKPLQPYMYCGALKADNKDATLNICENVLINLDELESTTRNDMSHLKSLITREKVKERRAYARLTEEFRRMAVFVASVNVDQIFNDPTGNRRFIIVSAKEIDYMHSIDMDLVFAQALALLKQGFQYWGDAQGNAELTANAGSYAMVDPVEELIQEYCEIPSHDDIHGIGCEWMTATAVVNEIASLGQKVRTPIERDGRRAGLVLTKLGFQKRVLKGRVLYHIKKINRSTFGHDDTKIIAPF